MNTLPKELQDIRDNDNPGFYDVERNFYRKGFDKCYAAIQQNPGLVGAVKDWTGKDWRWEKIEHLMKTTVIVDRKTIEWCLNAAEVLKTMCSKKGLTLGAESSQRLIDKLTEVMKPEWLTKQLDEHPAHKGEEAVNKLRKEYGCTKEMAQKAVGFSSDPQEQLWYIQKYSSKISFDENLRPVHKCKPLARAAMTEGRDWWVGELTERIPEWPHETHCLHLKTPLKDVVFLCNSGDFSQLSVLAAVALGYVIDKTWLESQIEIARRPTVEAQGREEQ